MGIDTPQASSASPTAPGLLQPQPSAPLWVGVAVVALVIAIFHETAASMVFIWWRSETFAHGFLIIPISLYLVWQRRGELTQTPVAPDWLGLILFAGLASVWIVARMVDVQVVQQLALVAMVIAALWAVLGRRIVWVILFPLGFLFFAVPLGEFLIYPMMDFTADFLVRMLQITGIPVYWEGTFISIPSGDWSIVEGCSGVRYLIASVAVGALYAYLFYYSWWRRLAFVVLAVGMPIIANGFRAYIIVMLGHLSNMKLATGVDHLIYGWVFFGLVIMLMFWIGSFWWDKPTARPAEAGIVHNKPYSSYGTVAMGLLVLGLAIASVLLVTNVNDSEGFPTPMLKAPSVIGEWRSSATPVTDWTPRYLGESAKLRQTYESPMGAVELIIYYYQGQHQGAELINSQNLLVVQKHPIWQNRGDTVVQVERTDDALKVRESLIKSNSQRLLVWDWYWIDGTELLNPWLAKLLEAKDKLLRIYSGSAAVFLVVEQNAPEKHEERELLKAFLGAVGPGLTATLEAAGGNVASGVAGD